MNSDRVLDLELRRQIYELVMRFGGCHFRELERKSGLASGTVKYHLAYLVRFGLVSSIRVGNNVRYYSKEVSVFDTELLGLLRQRSVRSILLYILVHPQCSHSGISVGLSASTVSFHLKKLLKANIVSGVNGKYIVADTEKIVTLLITYRESFVDRVVDNVVETWGI